MAKIVLGVTGSIAAYKAAELCRLIVKKGWEVKVVMSEAATKFVTPLTFQTLSKNKVALDQFALVDEWKPGHIALAKWADALVVAPCTANVIAKLAYGIADDELTATALATKAPIFLAPAMNDAMFENVATQENLARLKARGAFIATPGVGELACGTEGRGRMAEPVEILALLNEKLFS